MNPIITELNEDGEWEIVTDDEDATMDELIKVITQDQE